MKKYFILALVLLFATGTAMAADDTFKADGQYRMEMYSFTDNDHDGDTDDDQRFIDQRFRTRFSFMPADGVKAVLRGDYAETTWGDLDAPAFAAGTDRTEGPGGIGYRANQGAGTLMIDQAYADLTKAMVNVKAGLFGHGGLGNALTTDNQGANVFVTADFAPVQVKVLYTKLSEGKALTDDVEADDSDKDTDVMGAEAVFSSGAFSAGAFYATMVDNAADDTKNVIGVHGSTSMGNMSFWGEVDLYSGDDGAGTDYVGTMATLNGQMAVNEQLKVILDVFFATGNTDGDKDQISNLTDDWSYVPMDHGPFQWVQSTGINVHEIENDAGSQGLNIAVTYAVMDALTIYGDVGYVMPSEEDPDDNDVYVSSYTVFSVGAKYTFLPGTSFNVKYENISVSGENINDDPTSKIMGMLAVNF